MIRRIGDLVYIILFVWAIMIIGLWIVASFIVPLEIQGLENPIVIGSLKVFISLLLSMVWLWAWREIMRRTFWRTMKRQQHIIKNPEDK